jgi:hypothetical protein
VAGSASRENPYRVEAVFKGKAVKYNASGIDSQHVKFHWLNVASVGR